MTQELIVALIVAVAAVYALWYWMPRGLRQRLAVRLAGGSQRLGLPAAGAQRLADAVGTAGGCGACDSRSTCSSRSGPGGDAAAPGPERPRNG